MTLRGIAFEVILLSSIAWGHARTEYHAFWADTFNTNLNNHSDVVEIVSQAQAANANMILAQVRRRGDAWYLNSLEPIPDFTPFGAAFDPLRPFLNVVRA